jgi:hypothetical protein
VFALTLRHSAHIRLLQMRESERYIQHLLIEPGTVTREKHRNEPSTLDLALSTLNLTPWVISCKVVDAHLGSDHKPIVATFQTGSQARTSTALKRNFKKADTNAITAGAKWLQVPVQELATTQEIDNYADYLVGFTQELISQTVPYKAPSTREQAWWTPEVPEAIAEERRAHHQWSKTHTGRLRQFALAKRLLFNSE